MCKSNTYKLCANQIHTNNACFCGWKCYAAIMFTSDLSERGMDYPNVTSVIQVYIHIIHIRHMSASCCLFIMCVVACVCLNNSKVGAPVSREQYIHRAGRTARNDAYGHSILLLNSYEEKFIKQLSDLDIQPLSDETLLQHVNYQSHINTCSCVFCLCLQIRRCQHKYKSVVHTLDSTM